MPELHAQIVEKIVAALYDERKRLGWSQETLSVAAGVSNSCVRHLEHGRSTPTLITVLKLAGAMQMDVAKIIAKATMEVRKSKSERHTR